MKIITRNFTKKLHERLTEELNFLQIVVGPRQIGKTTGLKQIIKNWQGSSLMVTADELAAPSLEWLALQWQRAKQKGRASLLVIDEIQKIPGWSQAIKYLFDQDRRALKVVLLGSASLSLRQGMQESLAGRYELIDAHHWNLAECQDSLGWSLNEYLKFGGYPAAGELVTDLDRWQSFIRNSIVEPVLFKDILGLTSINKPALFRQTFELAMAYPAQEISLQKILGQLQDTGNVTTIKHYLELLEGAFLLKILFKYTGSEIRIRSSSPKIIPLNNGLIHGFHNPHDIDTDHNWRGRIFEAAVGASLATRSKGKLYYWRDGKFEVDFVLELDNRLYAIEVKSGRRRHMHGLAKFLQRYPQSIPVIIDSDNVSPLLQAENVDNLFLDGDLL
ncbi:MAG: ATP-binding protein [Deltaproteobacteria bacterium]|nr:ATP-binding protein [Candidatus Tharpella aukensis]